jgi:hypothetical protein
VPGLVGWLPGNGSEQEREPEIPSGVATFQDKGVQVGIAHLDQQQIKEEVENDG